VGAATLFGLARYDISSNLIAAYTARVMPAASSTFLQPPAASRPAFTFFSFSVSATVGHYSRSRPH